MARSSMVRLTRSLVALAPLLCAGCLFVGDVNGRPSAQIVVEDADQAFPIGSPIQLFARIEDDQPGATGALTVKGADGAPVPCMQQSPTPNENGWTLVFWDAGTYVVTVLPTDIYGVTGSSASVTIIVTDEAPTLDAATLSEGSPAVACGASWSASGPVPLALGAAAVNPDAMLDEPRPTWCSTRVEQTTYTWRLVLQPTGAGTLGLPQKNATCPTTPDSPMTTQTVEVPSATDTMPPVVCLYPDPSVSASTPSMYGVSLVVSTSAGSTTPLSIVVPVLGDAPACFDGAYPAAGAYVVPSDAPTVFQAVGADDVSPASALVYTWTVTRSDGTSTIVQAPTDGGDGGARLSLDPTVLGVSVGETLRLRAEVVEPGGTISCADADDMCLVSSCVAGGSTCPRRVTWSLEYR